MEYKPYNERRERILLTPSMAEEFISVNYENNRALKWNHINEIARSISLGEWNPYMVNQDIVLSDKGHLMDGQHRCYAVISANKSISTMISYNVPEEWFPQFDRGLSRKAADYIDCKNKNAIISIANYAICIEQGATLTNALKGQVAGRYKKGVVKPTREETVQFVNDNLSDIEDFYGLGARLNKCFYGGGSSAYAKPLWLINYLSDGADRSLIEAFVEKTEEGDNDTPVIGYMRKTVAQKQISASRNHTKVDIKYLHDIILVCYEQFIGTGEVPRGKNFNYVVDKYGAAVTSKATTHEQQK